jgi:hypothetical protein
MLGLEAQAKATLAMIERDAEAQLARRREITVPEWVSTLTEESSAWQLLHPAKRVRKQSSDNDEGKAETQSPDQKARKRPSPVDKESLQDRPPTAAYRIMQSLLSRVAESSRSRSAPSQEPLDSSGTTQQHASGAGIDAVPKPATSAAAPAVAAFAGSFAARGVWQRSFKKTVAENPHHKGMGVVALAAM